MFALTVFLGTYSYLIFLLGIINLLYPNTIILFSLIYFSGALYIYRKKIKNLRVKIKFTDIPPLLYILGILTLINLIGALGPELAFDALWYHLTIPKIYLENHQISFIPGGLFYYSVMPKLGEMFYISSLAMGNEILAKLVHFVFGVLVSIAIYKISKIHQNKTISLLVTIVFCSNLVFSWQSTTAYIDLIRTYFEIMAFWALIRWSDKKVTKWLIFSGLILGFAASAKVLSLGSLFIFIPLILYVLYRDNKASFVFVIKNLLIFVLPVFLVPLPWFIFSYLNTGSPVYPFFSPIYPVTTGDNIINLIRFLNDIFKLFTRSADPVSPIYLVIIPLGFIFLKKLSTQGRLYFIYTILAIIVWYITPRTGGGRFILPYLPVISLLVGEILHILLKNKLNFLYRYLIAIIMLLSISTITIRLYENIKYLPVVAGQQAKSDFLSTNLNFKFGDFYDTDGYFAKTIKSNDKVLLIGFHNLYYINFPFIHESYLMEGDKYNYIAVQGGEIPKEYTEWYQVYENELTGVKLYRKGMFIVKNNDD